MPFCRFPRAHGHSQKQLNPKDALVERVPIATQLYVSACQHQAAISTPFKSTKHCSQKEHIRANPPQYAKLNHKEYFPCLVSWDSDVKTCLWLCYPKLRLPGTKAKNSRFLIPPGLSVLVVIFSFKDGPKKGCQ